MRGHIWGQFEGSRLSSVRQASAKKTVQHFYLSLVDQWNMELGKCDGVISPLLDLTVDKWVVNEPVLCMNACSFPVNSLEPASREMKTPWD